MDSVQVEKLAAVFLEQKTNDLLSGLFYTNNGNLPALRFLLSTPLSQVIESVISQRF